MSAPTQAVLAQVEALREVMARDYGVTDTPTWDPAVQHSGSPEYDIEARSDRTRRAMLADLPPELREQRVAQAETYGLDLDSADVIRVRVHGYVDRRSERADPSTWTSKQGPPPPVPYDRWLREQVEQHIPAGYTPAGRPAVDPLAEVVAAKETVDAAPEALAAAVRAALERGVRAAQVAAAIGVSRARVYQLRDGKR